MIIDLEIIITEEEMIIGTTIRMIGVGIIEEETEEKTTALNSTFLIMIETFDLTVPQKATKAIIFLTTQKKWRNLLS